METAIVTRDGECQTVRLPKGYHLSTATVTVRHEGEAIVLEPMKPKSWPPDFFDSIHIPIQLLLVRIKDNHRR